MRKSIICFILSVFFIDGANALLLIGFYKAIDDYTNNAKAIVRLYECEDMLCGRIVALFDTDGVTIAETISDPVRVAEILDNKPHLDGLDVIWNMTWDADRERFSGGRIKNPETGRMYRGIIWRDPGDENLLRVRGMVGPFGRTQVWHVIPHDNLPPDLQVLDASYCVPVIR